MKPDESPKVIDPSFSSTELMESLSTMRKRVESPPSHPDFSSASALSTAELAEVAARGVGAPFWNNSKKLAGIGAAIVILLALVLAASLTARAKAGTGHLGDPLSKWIAQLPEANRSVLERWLAHGDRVSALVYLRGLRVEGKALPATLLARASLATELHEPVEALEALEQAVKTQPSIAEEPIFVRAAVQTFAAGRVTRTQALLGRVPQGQAVKELSIASMDWSYRVRHGAGDLLKVYGGDNSDEVAVNLLDLWQAENCEARRSIAAKLLAKSNDDRIRSAIEAASRRADDGCLSNANARARASHR